MISRKFLDAYQSEVDQASKEAGLYVKSVYQVFREQNPNATIAQTRNHLLEAINDSLSIFGGQASLIANDFFDELAQMAGEDVTSEMWQSLNMEQVNGSLHNYARKLVEGKVDEFEKRVVDLTAYHVKKEAFENLKYNCKKNGLAYARVPSGRETCAFCFIMASRGFVYDSEYSAGGKGNDYHPHCDCIIVPGFSSWAMNPDTQIEGFKPTEMAQRYDDCVKTVEGLLTKENYQKSGAYEKYGYNFSEWKMSIISSEIRQRDTKWLYSGLFSKYTKEKGAKPLPKESRVSSLLTKHGLGVVSIKEINENNIKTPDSYIQARKWEYKIPEGWSKANKQNLRGEQTIRKAFYKAQDKSSRLVISNVENNIDFLEFANVIDKVFNTGDFKIDEVLIVSYSGELLRLKK